ncbi:unnamed protein product [Periconia digitata]|uniref:Uncharacterized protein n=1 Tax=Periconia digitata TaxID=1303443 RepID=A0A9W4XKD9_9PLEO|nr:unnamed protein product [Periconia digitata]
MLREFGLRFIRVEIDDRLEAAEARCEYLEQLLRLEIQAHQETTKQAHDAQLQLQDVMGILKISAGEMTESVTKTSHGMHQSLV